MWLSFPTKSSFLWTVKLLLINLVSSDGIDVETAMTVPEMIQHWRYPVEIHQAITKDGYKLELHRIPFGRNGTREEGRPVIFLQHGLLASSADWVLNLPEQSAGFVFADAGFDVWLGNMRGNRYSRKHVRHSWLSAKFWQFSWDEMAEFDLPAMIDKALSVSGQSQVLYVAHSQGTLTAFAKLSTDPSFAQKIKMLFALAPIGKIQHIRGLARTLSFTLAGGVETFTKIFGSREFLPQWMSAPAMEALCQDRKSICIDLLFSITGADQRNFNSSRLPVYVAHFPSGTSTQNMLQWIQMVRKGSLAKFDRGIWQNLLNYGQLSAPSYKLERIPRLPLYLFSGGNDWLADPEDIADYLVKKLNHTIREHIVLPNYNHMDFTWGLRTADEVYRRIIDFAKNMDKNRKYSQSTCGGTWWLWRS